MVILLNHALWSADCARRSGSMPGDAPAAPGTPRQDVCSRSSSAEQPLTGLLAMQRGAPLGEACGSGGSDVPREIVMPPRRPPLTAAVSLPAVDMLPSPASLLPKVCGTRTVAKTLGLPKLQGECIHAL